MAKLEVRGTLDPRKDNIVMIPGGPGLGPISFLPIEALNKDFNVYFFYPSGTDGTIQVKAPSYDDLLFELENILIPLKNVILCGHSFGGIQAVELTARGKLDLKALVCVSAPFCEEVFSEANKIFDEFQKTKDMTIDKMFESSPNDEIYKQWFASYSEIYFLENLIESGRSMLLNDSVSVLNYLGAYADLLKKTPHLDQIKNLSLPKLFLAGTEDKLFLSNLLKKDSDRGGFIFKEVPKAGHFIQFENPNETLSIMKEFLIKRSI